MIKAVIFDMDGVIVDSERMHLQADNEVLKEFGACLSEEENIKYVGVSDKDVYAALKDRFNLPLPVEELIRKKVAIDVKLQKENPRVMPHAAELIKNLHSKGYKLAIASSSKKLIINNALAKFNLSGYFDAVVTADDVAKSKPDPAVFLEAARILGVDCTECVVIEDSLSGVLAANAAGISVVAVPNRYTRHQDLSSAELILNSLDEIDIETIKNMSGWREG